MQEEFHSGMDLLGMLLWHAEPKINPNHDEFSVNEDLRYRKRGSSQPYL